jgi:hypothetical protein
MKCGVVIFSSFRLSYTIPVNDKHLVLLFSASCFNNFLFAAFIDYSDSSLTPSSVEFLALSFTQLKIWPLFFPAVSQ